MIDIRDGTTLDLLPEALRKEPEIQAASFALHETAKMLLDKVDRSMVYAGIDILPEEIIDLLAEEFRAQYYDGSMSLQKKREAVKKAMQWYKKAGTLSAVDELVEFMYGEHKVHEWFQYDGQPYTFRVEIMGLNVQITEKGLENFLSALQKVKNTRSLLEMLIFHRRIDQKVYSGAAVASYSRQVIVDFYTEQKQENINLHSGTQRAHYSRQVIVDYSKGGSAARQIVHSGGVTNYVMKQTIKEG
ncbi:phage tail protein I [Eisenbergiella porci]|uniref:phage tail protein I n=1 Tax=Eisenbergiella porci TaxID=2652274 RepID=UPI002A80E153|nr:phage tail protein I [Eisenbergiella porci]